MFLGGFAESHSLDDDDTLPGLDLDLAGPSGVATSKVTEIDVPDWASCDAVVASQSHIIL